MKLRALIMAGAAVLGMALAPAAKAEVIGLGWFGPDSSPFTYYFPTYFQDQYLTADGLDNDTVGLIERLPNYTYVDIPEDDTLFRSAAEGGGLLITGSLPVNLYGPQLYSGDSTPHTGYTALQYGLYGTVGNSAPAYYQFFFTNPDPSITDAAPEPSTWMLLLVGIAGVGLALRKRPEDIITG